jgi:hypothetical protein
MRNEDRGPDVGVIKPLRDLLDNSRQLGDASFAAAARD